MRFFVVVVVVRQKSKKRRKQKLFFLCFLSNQTLHYHVRLGGVEREHDRDDRESRCEGRGVEGERRRCGWRWRSSSKRSSAIGRSVVLPRLGADAAAA